MFRRVRHLRISLAAKCQLLFGLAVVMIIGAALFVPWQRMEQLTEQLNERSARTLVDYTVDAHIAAVSPPTSMPATGVALATTSPTTVSSTKVSPTTKPMRDTPLALPPTTQPLRLQDPTIPPRLILAQIGADDTALPMFERRAIRRLTDHRDRDSYTQNYETEEGFKGFRFAHVDNRCVKCHLPGEARAATTNIAATAAQAKATEAKSAATGPATRAAPVRVLGIVAVDIPSQIETSQLLLNRVFILTAGMLAGTLAIVVFYLITTKLILQPVRVLQETAQKVSEGDLNIRSDISTGDEFQQLSETFNTMLTNLKISSDQLRAVNKSLDIKLGQLAESNVALYEANRLKSEFLANVSHELRTPLNSILGFADLLKDSSAASDPKNTRYIQNILGSGKNLLELINDLLDLAKIEAGRMEIRSEPLSLGDLFEGIISVVKPLTEQKGLTINASVGADVPIIHTDPAKLQQVLYNLISNAIKFSPAGEKIDLIAEREFSNGEAADREVRITVIDRGPGVAADKHQVIFEKFRQVDASVTRTHSGTGLGLAISKELITLLGGTIGIESVEGQGATFWIVLPLKNEAGVQDLRGKLVLS